MKLLLTLIGLSAAMWPSLAQAQSWEMRPKRGASSASTNMGWALELRFGPYEPKVDDGLAGQPYQDTFGDRTRFAPGFEVDWQALRFTGLGSLGPAFGWAMTRSTADAPLADGSGRSDQATSLSIMPMYLAAVARVDVLADTLEIPLSPYAKLGAGYALWWSKIGDETSKVNGNKARDTSYGWQYALGIMLHLSWMEPEGGRDLRWSSGANEASLFGEWMSSELDGFGSGDQMNVGTDTWVVGLAVQF